MVKCVFSVYDSKAEAYLTPFFTVNGAVAKRMCMAACMDENHEFSKFGADYTLFEIGQFDENTGLIVMDGSFKNLGNLLEMKATEEVVRDGRYS